MGSGIRLLIATNTTSTIVNMDFFPPENIDLIAVKQMKWNRDK